MIPRMTTALAAFFLLSVPTAWAGQCPGMAASIDAALANASVSDEVRSQIVELRDKGMAAHQAGQHAESVAILAQAQALLPN